MELDKNWIAMELERVLSAHAAEGFIEGMYSYFMMNARYARDRDLVLVELENAEASGTFDAKVCEDFKDWFSKVSEIAGFLSPYWFGTVPEDSGPVALHEDFKTLMMNSQDLMLLCFYLFQSIVRETYQLVLKSSDGLVLNIGKRAATGESEVLNDLVDSTGDRDEIPVPILHSRSLSKVIEFCEMTHGFGEDLRSLVYGHKDWVTKFVSNNHANFKELYHAADYLHIQSLLDLTSPWVVGREQSVEEISKSYGDWSISQALSSIWGKIVEDAGENGNCIGQYGPSALA